MPRDTEIDGLYQLPLAEFTAARNALAKGRKSAGDAGAADAIKALAKPSVSAWLVNQLWWRERRLFDALLAAGDAVRDAAQRGAGPAEQHEPAQQRKQALRALMRAAENHLQEGGHGTSTATLRKITTTLEACAAYGTNVPDPPPGRLPTDLDPPGFEVLAGFKAAPTPVPSKPTPAARVERAEAQLSRATESAQALSAAVDTATAAADDARLQLDAKLEVFEALEHAAVEARRAADNAKRELDKAQRAADAADQSVLDARGRADEARRDVEQLRGKADA